jgi:hypothetical protein
VLDSQQTLHAPAVAFIDLFLDFQSAFTRATLVQEHVAVGGVEALSLPLPLIANRFAAVLWVFIFCFGIRSSP